MRTPSVPDLESDSSYQKVLELDFNDMLPFVMKNIRQKGTYSFLYFLFNALSLSAVVLILVLGIKSGSISWQNFLFQGMLGVVSGSFLIIPFHELIHGLAYRVLGARRIIFGSDLTQFIFYVTAHRYPINKVQTIFLAMLPFMLINLSAWGICIGWFPGISFGCSLFLLSHNLMCIGDFAIANYVCGIQGKMYSFDDIELKKNYFYSKTD